MNDCEVNSWTRKYKFPEGNQVLLMWSSLSNNEPVLINSCEISVNKKVQISRKHLSARDVELNWSFRARDTEH